MTHRILHLSDTHVAASGFDQDGVNALASLDRILLDCRRIDGLDLVVVTGDVADDGSAEGCRLVRQRVAAFAADRGIPHFYTTGNHDRRPEFAEALGTGHVGADGVDVGQLLDECGDERAAVSEVRGLRVVTLDSLVPGFAHGVVSDAQLDALARLLETPAPAGTILAMHHPPIYVPTAPWMVQMGLHNRDAVRDVIDGSDVIAVLCGHFHLQLYGRLGGAAVWATPGVVTRLDLTAPRHLVRGVKGAGATVVDRRISSPALTARIEWSWARCGSPSGGRRDRPGRSSRAAENRDRCPSTSAWHRSGPTGTSTRGTVPTFAILHEGNDRARAVADATLAEVRVAMNAHY